VGLTSPAAQHGWTEFDILVPDELNHGLSGINCLDFAAPFTGFRAILYTNVQ